MDAEYYGLIKIGKPAKDYKMAFSSTWGDTWLPSEHCGLLEVACLMHTRYDSTKSSTYQPDGKPVAIKVGNDSLNGFISIDNFHLPHLPAVENQSFIEMTHMPNSYVLTKADGLIGLGFASLSTATVPLMYTLRKQNLIDKSIFTFYFNRDETTDKAGRLILGSTERKHVKVDTLTTLPVTSKTYWEVKMVRVVMDVKKKSYPFCIDGCSAILSTTSNLIYVPKSDIEKINDFLGARKFLPDYFQPNRYMVNCRDYAKLADMHFVFGHEQKNFTINSKYYIQKFRYESVIVCLSPFVDGDEGQWILGGAFLMQFYTEYDLDNARVVIGQTIF